MIPLHWHTEPLLLACLLFPGWLFTIATGPLRNRLAPGSPWPRRHTLLFLAGLAFAYLTVGSPLDQLGEDFLFSAHMMQHTMLIYCLPVLFLLGTPHWLVDGTFFSKKKPAKVFRFLVHPLFAGPVFTLCFTFWHIPVLYESALYSKRIHILEHWTMFASAILMWWPILSPSRLLPPILYPLRMIYVFLLMVAQIPLFAFLTFTSDVHYPTYSYAPRLEFLNLSPIEDQTFGGVIMKISNMIVSLAVFGISFFLWARERDQREAG